MTYQITEVAKCSNSRAPKKLLPEFTFQYWLKEQCEVACVYELATGLCFPRRGALWLGLLEELQAIKKMMMAESEPRTLGYFAKLWLQSRIDR